VPSQPNELAELCGLAEEFDYWDDQYLRDACEAISG
jgi:hypothetical protein